MPPHDESATLATQGPLGSQNRRKQQGRSVELSGSPSSGKTRETVIFTGAPLKGNDESNIGDALASTLTVTLSLDVPPNVPAAAIPLVVARVRWGSDGHQTEAVCDWKQGTVIQVCGSFLEVIAELVEDSFSAETLVTVGAFVGYYAARAHPATLTEFGTVPANPAPGLSVLVPRMANRLHVAPAVVGATFNVSFLDSVGGVISIYSQAAFATGGSVPVPNGAQSVLIAATAAGFDAIALFELAI